MRPVDRLVAAYVVFITAVIVVRGLVGTPEGRWLLGGHALIALLLFLFTRLEHARGLGRIVHICYPIVLTPALYWELGILNLQLDVADTYARDALVQRWEAALFSTQISYEWIRNAPSVFWSAVLHLAYFSYYPIVVLGPVILLFRREFEKARHVVFATMIAFLSCYVVFVLFPVAGPNYAFEHPTGPVREVWSARLVYWVLDGGSAFGTAFPSSHVAATVAAVVALWSRWKPLAAAFTVPTILLVIGTVYCQMHYGVDAAAGLAVGLAAGWTANRGRGTGGVERAHTPPG